MLITVAGARGPVKARSAERIQRASQTRLLCWRCAWRSQRARGADTARFRKSDDPGCWIVDPVTPVDVADREDGPQERSGSGKGPFQNSS